MKKKNGLIAKFSSLALIVLLIVTIIIWYNSGLNRVSKTSEEVTFIIESGTSKKQVIDNLVEANLIKSKYASYIYIKLHDDINFQAGTYNLNRNMNAKSIFATFESGFSDKDTVNITFIEGVTLKNYVEQISDATGTNYDDLIKQINSKEFLEPLINDYWFLTNDILNDDLYYGLEGYLFPNTYQIYKSASLDNIIRKMLDETDKQLNKHKEKIDASSYSIHDILTMASIIEKEAVTKSDREKVSQVIYTRLERNMNLGMDVTAYYGAQLDMKETITNANGLIEENAYNTRVASFLGLPVGPICNPSIESIASALNPSDTDYIYFYADVSTGKVYFTADYNEFLSFQRIYG